MTSPRCLHCGTQAHAYQRQADAWEAHRRLAALFGSYTAAPVLDALQQAIRLSERWTWRLACPERHLEVSPSTPATPLGVEVTP